MKRSSVSRSRRTAGAIASACVATLALAGCVTGESGQIGAGGGTLDDLEPMVLRISDVNPETASNAIAISEWADYVTEATEGKITFETYFSGTLHSGSDALDALDDGLTDITFFFPGFFPDKLPTAVWATQYFGAYASVGFPQSLLASGPAAQRYYEESEAIRNELAQYNATVFALNASGTFDLLCVDPVDSPEAARGVLVNTSGLPWLDEVAAVGLTPEFIEIPEEYEALQRGVIECTVQSVSPLMTRGTWEVAKHYNPADFSPALFSGYMIRKDLWESLPADVQQIMFDGKALYMKRFTEIAGERYAEFAEAAPDQGIEFHDPARFNEVLAGFLSERASGLISAAPDSVTDPEAEAAIFADEVQRWLEILEGDLGVPVVEKTPEGLVELYASIRDVPWQDYQEAIAESLAEFRPR